MINICLFCKKEFIDRRKQFCSLVCRRNNIKIKLSCAFCKKEYYKIPSRKRERYCSYKCGRDSTTGIYSVRSFWLKATAEEKMDAIKKSFEEKVIKKDGCWGWSGGLFEDNYAVIRIFRKTEKAHRASWLIHNGEIPKDLWVLHKCDVRSCSNPDHLFLGTAQDNITDMMNKKRNKQVFGQSHGQSKFTENQVIEIRQLLNNNITTIKEVANKYKVAYSTISNIKLNKSWKHLV